MSVEPDCLVYGASARGVCWSAVRAGLQPIAYDLFADIDFPDDVKVYQLQLLSLQELRNQLQLTYRGKRPLPLLAAGGWENESLLNNDSSKDSFFVASTWGHKPAVMKLARDPFHWTRLLRDQQLPHLLIRNQQTTAVDDAENSSMRWLRKSLHGAGGLRVRRLESGETSLPVSEEYDQQELTGIVCSAQFSGVHLLGSTRQIVGSESCPEFPFIYGGNLYPLESFVESTSLPENPCISEVLSQLGEVLSAGCGLTGLWGLDFLLNDQKIYPLEINPRYTAAMELIELAEGRSLLTECQHLGANCSAKLVDVNLACRAGLPEKEGQKCIGKQIVYAPQEFILPKDWNWNCLTWQLGRGDWKYDCWEVPLLSDLPKPGSHFRPGDPVCTIWAESTSGADCLELLKCRQEAMFQQISHFPA